MNLHHTLHALTLVMLLLASGLAEAQGRRDFGRREYIDSCASCHGAGGQGDGPLVRHLVKLPTDLTLLSRRNGGVFPSQRVMEVIDGRGSTELGPHGSREMPIWGSVYRAPVGDDPLDAERFAQGRIAALMDYLVRIQQK